MESIDTTETIEGAVQPGNFIFIPSKEKYRKVVLNDNYSINCLSPNNRANVSRDSESNGECDMAELSKSPYIFLEKTADIDTINSILKTWGLKDHIIFSVCGKHNANDPSWIKSIIHVMQMARDYECPIACIYIGECTNAQNLTAAGMTVVRVLSNITDEIDIEGDVRVSLSSVTVNEFDRHSHYLLTKLSEIDILKLIAPLPGIPCIFHPKGISQIKIDREFTAISFLTIDSMDEADAVSIGLIMKHLFKIVGKCPPEIKAKVGKAFRKVFCDLRKMGIIAEKNKDDQIGRVDTYFVHNKISQALPKLIALDLPNNILLLDIQNKDTDIDKLHKLLNICAGYRNTRLLIVDPNALLMKTAQAKEKQMHKKSPSSMKTVYITSVKAMKKHMRFLDEGECNVETLNLTRTSAYCGTYHICAEGIDQKMINELINSHATKVIRVTYMPGEKGCMISHEHRKKGQKELSTIERYIMKSTDYVSSIITACLTQATKEKGTKLKDDTISVIKTIEKWELNDVPSSMLMKIAPNMFDVKNLHTDELCSD